MLAVCKWDTRANRTGPSYLGNKEDGFGAGQLVGLPRRRQAIRSPAGAFVEGQKQLQEADIAPFLAAAARELDLTSREGKRDVVGV